MGEATYYMRIRFPKGTLKKKLPEIQNFFKEGLKAGDWWQKNRGREDGASFWTDFEKEFPMVTEYVKTLESSKGVNQRPQPVWGNDHNNGLAGNLDFAGYESDIEQMGYEKTPHGDELIYSSMVWHFAEWGPLIDFVQKKWGGSKSAWQSEECMNENGSCYPSLENHENIVEDLLKHPESLPPLIGINKDLDELISETLKK